MDVSDCARPKRERSPSNVEDAATLSACAKKHTISNSTDDRSSPMLLTMYHSKRVDFALLACADEEFRKYVTYSTKTKLPKVDFSDANTVYELTRATLFHHYDISWSQPISNLCPPIPQRRNYLDWISSLPLNPKTNIIRGIDIGCGASCIYPLLGYSLYKWEFVATEIDDESIKNAQLNIDRNDLISKICIRKPSLFVDSEGILVHHILEGIVFEQESFQFSMCNPPFFDLDDNAHIRIRGYTIPATQSERSFSGGEFEFVRRMMNDSIKLRTQVTWYTTMLGRKINLSPLKAEAFRSGATRVLSTEFHQGKTSRWGLAWSFDTSVIPTKFEIK